MEFREFRASGSGSLGFREFRVSMQEKMVLAMRVVVGVSRGDRVFSGFYGLSGSGFRGLGFRV